MPTSIRAEVEDQSVALRDKLHRGNNRRLAERLVPHQQLIQEFTNAHVADIALERSNLRDSETLFPSIADEFVSPSPLLGNWVQRRAGSRRR